MTNLSVGHIQIREDKHKNVFTIYELVSLDDRVYPCSVALYTFAHYAIYSYLKFKKKKHVYLSSFHIQ